jgi:hypothetical protein
MTGIRLWGRRVFGAIYLTVHSLPSGLWKGLGFILGGWIMNGVTGVKVAWLTELRLSVIIQMHCTSEKSRIFAFNINIIDPKPT